MWLNPQKPQAWGWFMAVDPFFSGLFFDNGFISHRNSIDIPVSNGFLLGFP